MEQQEVLLPAGSGWVGGCKTSARRSEQEPYGKIDTFDFRSW
jgi:hypothetical protein